MSHDSSAPEPLEVAAARPSWRGLPLAALLMIVVAAYFSRLTALPVCGEESRWATVAREMIASGDWVVPRQQGLVFPERPPLGSWAMAIVGIVHGEVDLLAIRLPSACAILLTTLLIFACARCWMSPLGAWSSALMFATFGQVLQIGRLGESEAVFTLFAGGALLVWQCGYVRQVNQAYVWPAAYAMAALGALVKGLQSPIYLVAVTGMFLILRRDWKWLFSRWHALGMVLFAAIVAAWMTPFAAAQWEMLDDIWAGLAQDRFTLGGLFSHVTSFPWETLGCLLPWSPLFLLLLRPSVRKAIFANRPAAHFLVVAIAVTYPTVWFAAGARGRYYMPLYPCIALLLGLLVEHAAQSDAASAVRRVWRQYLGGLGLWVIAGGIVIVVGGLLPWEKLAPLRQPAAFLLVFALGAAVAGTILMRAAFEDGSRRTQLALAAVAGFVVLAYVGGVLNVRIRTSNDLSAPVAEVKRLLGNQELVSLGRVYHRFAYCYDTPMRQVPWPTSADELPSDVTYFCFDRRLGDTAERRVTNDGRLSHYTSGTLPFEWETVAEIRCDPTRRDQVHSMVVVGRVRRPAVVTGSGAGAIAGAGAGAIAGSGASDAKQASPPALR